MPSRHERSRDPRPSLVIVIFLLCGSLLSWCGFASGDSDLIPLSHPLEGFGTDTAPRILGRPYQVSNLNDSGPGSFRDAVSEPYRYIYFSVAGTITLESNIKVTTHHLYIDGFTAPFPGITLSAGTLLFANLNADTAHDIVLRNIRIQDSYDNLGIGRGAYNIVVDHCSMRRAEDGNIDIYDRVHDVTIQWCILADNIKNSLIRDDVENLSIHHNIYVHGYERNPQVQADCLTVDFVNNVIYDWDNYGSRIRTGSTGNYIKNVFIAGGGSDLSDALVILDASVYTEGNVIPPECDGEGNRDTRWPAPPVTEMDPQAALFAVLEGAGAVPRDLDDQGYIADIWNGMDGIFLAEGNPAAGDLTLDVQQPVPGSGVEIVYSSDADGPVRLGVYDVRGRRVALLAEEGTARGRRGLTWNGTTDMGRRAGSGFYFLRLESGRQSLVRKLLLLRY